jgi:hypothetical protein
MTSPRRSRRDGRDISSVSAFVDYSGPSRLTDPGESVHLLDALPVDLDGICAFGRERTMHHNLAAARGLPAAEFARIWPPALPDMLKAREVVIGACVLESYLLAGLLRHRGFEVRVRAGYFRNVRKHPEHVLGFWRRVATGKGRAPDDEYTRRQNAVDHRIEHWLCEVREDGNWIFVDANTDSLAEHSGMEVGIRLPPRHFEHAHEAWFELQAGAPPERYAEEPGRGVEHVRRQLLQDFFSLLNHDLAGVDELQCGDQTYEALAGALARGGDVNELIALYRRVPDLHLASAEADPFSFL